MHFHNRIVILIVLFLSFTVNAQEDLLKTIDSIEPETDFNTLATFKATRISIGQSVITREKGVLEVTMQNRFWNTPNPTSNAFAADKLNARFELAYAFTDKLTIGAGYGTGYNSIDAFAKYRLLFQKDTGSKFPVSVTLFQNIVLREKNASIYNTQSLEIDEKLGFTSQLLVARKISPKFSLQFSPSYTHIAVNKFSPGKDVNRFMFGFGARYKVGGHVSIVSEYYALLNKPETPQSYGPFALGVNWEVADLQLQFNLTNARNLVEDKFLAKTLQNFNFKNGNLHFGFQATYLIHFKKK